MSKGSPTFTLRRVHRVAFAMLLPFGALQMAAMSRIHGQSASSAHIRGTVTCATKLASEWDGVLRLAIAPGWHIYGAPSGTSGIPTTLLWTLTSGWHTVVAQWPTASQEIRGRDTTYEYSGTVVLPLKLQADRAAAAGTQKLTVKFGVCKEICIAEQLSVSVRTARR